MPQQDQGQQQDPLADFRALGEQIMAIGKKFPETSKVAAQMLKMVQEMQTSVAGNPQRTPDKQAPPMA